ncbi:MAG: hypothetical protein DI536_15880 [Archangium gephyra]|uniref:Uncharacterized protein n=1 Tax=Archangium gephyra TaxID=48 RepID=A0A2W5TH05_9BACT|nr:MAG: hypothetical protein DI536_15880 [Archangium gephyra]
MATKSTAATASTSGGNQRRRSGTTLRSSLTASSSRSRPRRSSPGVGSPTSSCAFKKAISSGCMGGTSSSRW